MTGNLDVLGLVYITWMWRWNEGIEILYSEMSDLAERHMWAKISEKMFCISLCFVQSSVSLQCILSLKDYGFFLCIRLCFENSPHPRNCAGTSILLYLFYFSLLSPCLESQHWFSCVISCASIFLILKLSKSNQDANWLFRLMYNLFRNAYAFFWLHVCDLSGNPSGWDFSFSSYLNILSDMSKSKSC